jgi:hypothetical protein
MPREPTVKVIVYADFNCLHCYLASQRADRLARAGAAQVDWRAVEHDRRLPVSGIRPDPARTGWDGELAEAAELALPGERLPAAPPSVVSNTAAAVAAYAEAVSDGVQDELRRRLFDAIWAQGRNLSSAYDVRRVVLEVMWPAEPLYPHLVSPDLPPAILHDPDLNQIVRRSGGIITPDGGPLTTEGYWRSRHWRQEWAALPEQAGPVVVTPSGRIHAGPDGLHRLAGIAGPAAMAWQAAIGQPGEAAGTSARAQ